MKKVTFDRRKIRMSLEGWYFTCVLMFIGTAAILRRANLLLILAAMLTAPILLNWRFVMSSLRHLIIKRRTPKHVVAGQLFHVSTTVCNESKMDSWQVQIDEAVVSNEEDRGLPVEVVVDRVPRKSQTTRSYECLLTRRGVYKFLPTIVSTSYPLGLIRASAEVSNRETLWVAPPIGTLADCWFGWSSQEELDDTYAYRQPGIHDGMFHGVREYRQGDSRRSIHWRSTAKLGKPAVKQFEKQGSRELNLVADLFSSKPDSYDHSCEVVLSLVFSLIENALQGESCQLNLLLVGQRTELIRGTLTPRLRQQIIQRLAEAHSTDNHDLHREVQQFIQSVDPTNQLLVASSRSSLFDQPFRMSNRLGLPEFLFQAENRRETSCIWLNVLDVKLSDYFRLPRQLDSFAPESGEDDSLQNSKHSSSFEDQIDGKREEVAGAPR